jgi:SAM-dependent methyltransferase
MARLNRAFGTDVQVIEATLQEARLPTNSIDTVYSISTIEHIPVTELQSLMKGIGRILRPGGLCVLTVDLFLNLWPFSDLACNAWGTNVSVKSLVDFSGLSLVLGRRAELLGYAEFHPREILAHLEDFLIGSAYPVLAQCLVLRKHTRTEQHAVGKGA